MAQTGDEQAEKQRANQAFDRAIAQAAAEYHKLLGIAVSGFGTSMTHATDQLAQAFKAADSARQSLIGPAQTFFDTQVAAAELAATAIIDPASRVYAQSYADAKATFDSLVPQAQAVYQARVDAANKARNATLAT